MISIDLSGRTILITGALGAIAEQVVRRLAEAGATLVLTDIKPEMQAKRTLDEWKITPTAYIYAEGDITDSKQVEAVVKTAFDKYPGMDTVIGHAGGCGLHRIRHHLRSRVRAHFPLQLFCADVSGAFCACPMGGEKN